VYDEIPLLRGVDWAASEGSIDVEGRCFGAVRSFYYDDSDLIECSPIAPKLLDVDLVID
jgi:hypothetical protein